MTEKPIRKSFIKKMGDVLVYVFHPAFLYFYFFFLTVNLFNPTFNHAWLVTMLVFIFSILIPASVPFLYAKDNFLKDRRRRTIPLIVTIACYTITYFIIRQFWLPYGLMNNPIQAFAELDILIDVQEIYNGIFAGYLLKMSLCLTFGLIAILIINRFYKISLHANGIGFLICLPTLFILGILKYPNPYHIHPNLKEIELLWYTLISYPFIYIASYLVLWQRLYSKSHTLDQIISGFFLGFTGTALIMSFWPNAWL